MQKTTNDLYAKEHPEFITITCFGLEAYFRG